MVPKCGKRSQRQLQGCVHHPLSGSKGANSSGKLRTLSGHSACQAMSGQIGGGCCLLQEGLPGQVPRASMVLRRGQLQNQGPAPGPLWTRPGRTSRRGGCLPCVPHRRGDRLPLCEMQQVPRHGGGEFPVLSSVLPRASQTVAPAAAPGAGAAVLPMPRSWAQPSPKELNASFKGSCQVPLT